MDFLSGLMSVATGAAKGYAKYDREQTAREQDIIGKAEEDAGIEVLNVIEDARTDLRGQQNTFNSTFNTQISNYNQIRSDYADEYQYDLRVLSQERPDIFAGTDLEKVRQKVKEYMSFGPLTGGRITAESDVYKQYVEKYGDVSGAQAWSDQQTAMNDKVRNNMSQLVGLNSSKLMLDPYMTTSSTRGDATYVRDKALEGIGEGRVTRDKFLSDVSGVSGMEGIRPQVGGQLMETVNWVPSATKEEIEAAAFEYAPGGTPQDQLNRERYKHQYYMAVSKNLMQHGNVDNLDEAIDIAIEAGVVPRGSGMLALSALDRAIVGYVIEREQLELRNNPMGADAQIIQDYNVNRKPTPEWTALQEEYRTQAKLNYTQLGYYDLFNQFINVGDDPDLNVKWTGEVQETPDSPFIVQTITSAIDPQISADGFIRLVRKDNIYETITSYDVGDIFGTFNAANPDELLTGPSDIFKDMDATQLRKIKEKIAAQAGGYDAILPFLLREKQIQIEDPDTSVIEDITEQSIETLGMPPKRNLSTGRGKGALNPAYDIWIEENADQWNANLDWILANTPEKWRKVPAMAGKPEKTVINSEWTAWNKKYKDYIRIGPL